MLDDYVLLDLETTGATPLRDRITEIALIRFRDGIEIDRWQTLVNPQANIPDFIQSLTGITNEMVEDAPVFECLNRTSSSQLFSASSRHGRR
jgi:DNA polymerase-3 subunit epsilon